MVHRALLLSAVLCPLAAGWLYSTETATTNRGSYPSTSTYASWAILPISGCRGEMIPMLSARDRWCNPNQENVNAVRYCGFTDAGCTCTPSGCSPAECENKVRCVDNMQALNNPEYTCDKYVITAGEDYGRPGTDVQVCETGHSTSLYNTIDCHKEASDPKQCAPYHEAMEEQFPAFDITARAMTSTSPTSGGLRPHAGTDWTTLYFPTVGVPRTAKVKSAFLKMVFDRASFGPVQFNIGVRKHANSPMIHALSQNPTGSQDMVGSGEDPGSFENTGLKLWEPNEANDGVNITVTVAGDPPQFQFAVSRGPQPADDSPGGANGITALHPGVTYTFDLSDSSLDGYPFMISENETAPHTFYANGVRYTGGCMSDTLWRDSSGNGCETASPAACSDDWDVLTGSGLHVSTSNIACCHCSGGWPVQVDRGTFYRSFDAASMANYALEELSHIACINGKAPVLNAQACAVASVALGGTYMGEVDQANNPPGCFRDSNTNEYRWNGHPTGAASPQSNPVCTYGSGTTTDLFEGGNSRVGRRLVIAPIETGVKVHYFSPNTHNMGGSFDLTPSTRGTQSLNEPGGRIIVSPNLKDEIQQVVDMSGWSGGNAIMLLVQRLDAGTGTRWFKTYLPTSQSAQLWTPVPLHGHYQGNANLTGNDAGSYQEYNNFLHSHGSKNPQSFAGMTQHHGIPEGASQPNHKHPDQKWFTSAISLDIAYTIPDTDGQTVEHYSIDQLNGPALPFDVANEGA